MRHYPRALLALALTGVLLLAWVTGPATALTQRDKRVIEVTTTFCDTPAQMVALIMLINHGVDANTARARINAADTDACLVMRMRVVVLDAVGTIVMSNGVYYTIMRCVFVAGVLPNGTAVPVEPIMQHFAITGTSTPPGTKNGNRSADILL